MVYQTRLYFIVLLIFWACLTLLQFYHTQTELMCMGNLLHSEIGDTTFKYLTHLGDGNTMLLFSLVLIVFFSIKNGLELMIGFAVSGIIAQLLKRLLFENSLRPIAYYSHEAWFNRVEGVPLHSAMSFPSGHTTTIFTLCTLIVLLYPKKWIQFTAITMAILAGISRVYLNQHFPKDVFAGSILGTSIAIIIYYILKDKWRKLASKNLLQLK